jgi:predicted nucleic acid-binding protein
MKLGRVVGPLVMDAGLAAIANEHGAILHTTNRAFARAPGLRFVNPLL